MFHRCLSTSRKGFRAGAFCRAKWLSGAILIAMLGCGGSQAPGANPAVTPEMSGTPAAPPPSEGETPSATAPTSEPVAPTAPSASAPVVEARGCPEPKDRSRTQLAATDVQELVTANRAHLHAACWKPAIAKNPKGPDKVRVATEIQVEGDGHVREVKIVGGKDYEGFAPCLERELRTWCFPGAKSPSSLMFPMVFVKAEGEMMAVPRGSTP